MRVMCLNNSVNRDFKIDENSDIGALLSSCEREWGCDVFVSTLMRVEDDLEDNPEDNIYVLFSKNSDIEIKYLYYNSEIKSKDLPIGKNFCSIDKIIDFYVTNSRENFIKIDKYRESSDSSRRIIECCRTFVFGVSMIGVITAAAISGPSSYWYVFVYIIAGFFIGGCVYNFSNVLCFEAYTDKLERDLKKNIIKTENLCCNYLENLKEILDKYSDNSLLVSNKDIDIYNDLINSFRKIMFYHKPEDCPGHIDIEGGMLEPYNVSLACRKSPEPLASNENSQEL